MLRVLLSILHWIAGHIPTLLIWAGLGGLFVYGNTHGWKFPEKNEKENVTSKEEQGGHDHADHDHAGHDHTGHDHEPFVEHYREQADGVPVRVTHDPAHCPNIDRPIKLKEPALAGVKTIKVGYDTVAATVTAHGEVVQDATAMGKASPRAGGSLFALEKRPGDPVRKGELLALVDAAEVGKAKAAYLTARAVLESRARVLTAIENGGVSPPRSIVEAEAAVSEAKAAMYSARQSFANLGLPLPTVEDEKLSDEALTTKLLLLGVPQVKCKELVDRAAKTAQPITANLLPVFSPLDGVVTKRNGVVGETVAAQAAVFEVGDPTRIDVFLEVRQEDMPKVTPGQSMTYRLEGGPDLPAVNGTIDWIGPALDEKTRTVRIRGRVPNPGGIFRSGAFGVGVIKVEPDRQVLVVPSEAVHWEGCSHFVFVMTSESEYQPRRVKLGARQRGTVEIVNGLKLNDEIAVVGSHVLKGELLKERIGAPD